MVVQEVMEDYDTGYNSFNTIKLEGKYLTLPCNFKLIEDLGYELKEYEKNMVIPAKSFIRWFMLITVKEIHLH